MKQVKDYILELMTNNTIDNINSEFIYEKLQAKYLISLAKWLREFGSKNKNQYSNKSFSGVFGGYYNRYEWDKITDTDFKKFDKGDKEGLYILLDEYKNPTAQNNLLALFLDENENIKYVYNNANGIILINQGSYTKDYPKDERGFNNYGAELIDVKVQPGSYHSAKQKDIRELCKQYNFYICELSRFSTDEKRINRENAKTGMINQSDYRKIADENINRYKKIIAKNKAEKLAKTDNISPKIQEILTKVLELSTKVMQGGAKYADLEYRMSDLLESCYGERQYIGHKRSGAEYRGYNGLLKLYANYVQTNMSSLKGNIYGRNNAEQYITQIEKKLEHINNVIDEIESRL